MTLHVLWELVHVTFEGLPETSRHGLWRARVPGGWWVTEVVSLTSRSPSPTRAWRFVADPDHDSVFPPSTLGTPPPGQGL